MKARLRDRLPRAVRIVEVGPRDGLQNQSRQIPTDVKVEWIRRLDAVGLSEIEATSFVHPKWVPQLADATPLLAELARGAPLKTPLSALVPNLKGLEPALAGGLERIALFTAASETFSQKNTNASIEETLARFVEVFAVLAARPTGGRMRVRGYVSTCFGCPYEGAIAPAAVVRVARRLRELGCAEIALSDTIGVATPAQVEDVVLAVAEHVPLCDLALHLHDTRGTALANVYAGLLLGVRTFDASAGGLGGCPFAPGAAGNLATEDLVYMLQGLGLASDVDIAALGAATLWFESQLGATLPGRVLGSLRVPHK